MISDFDVFFISLSAVEVRNFGEPTAKPQLI
jgi:hypothetical protein